MSESATIILSNGKTCLIDKCDVDLITLKSEKYPYQKNPQIIWREKKWNDKLSYAITMVRICADKWQMIRMHRLIMGITDPRIQVDHRDNDGLNNRRYNLRVASVHQNSMNTRPRKGTSKFKGVCFQKNKWRATIMHNYKSIGLGSFDSEFEAALAYDKKAKELFGEFARLNNPASI